jgi:transposase
MRTLTLNPEQQRDVEILSRVEAGVLDVGTAAQLLGVGLRQLRRKRAQFRTQGMAAVVHGNTGRTPANRTEPHVVARIVAVAGPEGRYAGVNVSHLQELLARCEGVEIGRSTLDRLLKAAGVSRRRPTPKPAHRMRRPRKGAEGMLVQIDGSPFAWLEGRGPHATLLGAIDDATSKVLYLHFRPTEDQLGYLLLLRTLVRTYGLPMALYHDRHTILRSPKQPTLADELAGRLPMSQIQRIMHTLGVESIPAYSPQAKGRIERLWGTLQNRLTTELRLAGVATLEEANAFVPSFLEQFNARFAVAPHDPEPAWVPLPDGFDEAAVFAILDERTVSRDHCVRHAGRTLQLLPSPTCATLVGKTIQVHVTPEDETFLYTGGTRLAYTLLDPTTGRPQAKSLRQAATPATPPADMKTPTRKPNPKQRAWLYGSR